MNTVIMGSYTDVKNLIISNIKANGQREITGPILQDVLLNMLENSSRVEEITYSDLKTLRDGTKLTPSRLYRITDYITTTVQSNTKSAGHHFDVIVLALSETELLEQAWVIHHEGDEYFTNNNLSAWKIWYCIDNDTNRFAWADATNGKGVIYRMIDEFNNDIPYDFKNIQFKHPNDTNTYKHYYYTFASSNTANNTDYSLSIKNRCYSNTIGEYTINNKMKLNCIIFIGNYCFSNSFGNGCYYNTFGSACNKNSFGSSCFSNSFDDGCVDNSFGVGCYSNSLGNGCSYNSFGNGCYSNSLTSNCYNNSFGERCYSNSLGNACNSNSFGNACNSNSFNDDSSYNSFGNYCSNNSLGNDCLFNSFGNGCSYIKFASTSSASNKYKYYRHNHFGDDCKYILFKGVETASSLDQVQNYNFSQGLKGTSSSYLIIDGKRNRAYETYISRDTDGAIKESVIAEFENRLGNCVDLTTEQTINAAKTFSAGIDLNGTRISKVGSPINTDDAANKEYVDDAVKNVDDKVTDFKNAGYLYAGVATPTTDPGMPDVKVFYIANGKGEYINFGGLDVTEDDVVILYYDTVWHKVATGIASNEKLAELSDYAHKSEVRHIERDLGMYPELDPVPLNPEVTGKYINSDGKYVDASGWNVASIGAVSLGNTYLLNMVSSSNMVLGVALFVSRVYKRDKEGKIIGTVLTPLFSAKNTSIPASGYVLFEAMDDYEEVLICYKPELTTQMLVARWGFKASHATQLRNLRLIVDNKTDFEGIYELLTAGYALNLVGKGNGEPQAFMSRKTGGGNITDGSAVIKEVDGVQPIVWNQLVKNGNFADGADGWFFDGSGSVSNNEATVTATSSVTGAYCRPLIIKEHKYLIELDVKVSELKPVRVYFGTNVSDNISVPITTANLYVKYGGIIKAIQDENLLQINSNLSVGETITIKNVYCIDLTQMFDAGNEPSTYEEYLDRISHYHIADEYAYNAGEVVNYKGVGIKTTGRNLWDEEWEVGSLDSGTGQPVAGASIFRSKNYCPILGGTEYYLTSASFLINLFYYDKDKNFIVGKIFYGGNVAFTTPRNAAYFKVRTDSPNNIYNHDICINLSDPAFNGQYEPYKSYVRDWSEVMQKYFPDGMTSLNGVKDFFNDKKAVRKWGCKVFDGTEEWQGGNGLHYTYLNNLIDVKSFGELICSSYRVALSFADMQNNDKTVSKIDGMQSNLWYVHDSSYSLDAWKSHLADLYTQGNPLVVYYELSEPVEDIFDKPLNLTYTVINGGTETSLATENSTQFEGSIAYNKDYVAVVDELQMQNRVTQIEFENWEN